MTTGIEETLVSVGLPVRNGERTLEHAARSALAQDHENVELVISDNASTDGTEALCRELAAKDKRIVYHRHAQNVGLLANYVHAMRIARGRYFCWIGDDDWLAPNYLSRCLQEFAADSRLVLVTTQIQYTRPDGSTFTSPYWGRSLRSDDPLERFEEVVALLAGEMAIDPLYALMRRSVVVPMARRNMMREDEVFATRLALAGPWGHVPETLARRYLKYDSNRRVARRLGVPAWQGYIPTAFECREMLRGIAADRFTASQRWRARLAVARLFMRRQYQGTTRRARKLVRLMTPA